MSQLVEELVKSGQHNNLMSTILVQNWESTTIAGPLKVELICESGATPLIQKSIGSIALSQSASQPMIVKKVIHLESRI